MSVPFGVVVADGENTSRVSGDCPVTLPDFSDVGDVDNDRDGLIESGDVALTKLGDGLVVGHAIAQDGVALIPFTHV